MWSTVKGLWANWAGQWQYSQRFWARSRTACLSCASMNSSALLQRDARFGLNQFEKEADPVVDLGFLALGLGHGSG